MVEHLDTPGQPHEQLWHSTACTTASTHASLANASHISFTTFGKSLITFFAGLGPSAGQVWRVGLMGYNATAANIELVLTAFRQGLGEQGYSKSQPKTQNPQETRVDYP